MEMKQREQRSRESHTQEEAVREANRDSKTDNGEAEGREG